MYDLIIHMSSKKRMSEDVPVSFRLPLPLRQVLQHRAKQLDLNFSQLCRRAIRRELVAAGIMVESSALPARHRSPTAPNEHNEPPIP